jgi:hypothetical protein
LSYRSEEAPAIKLRIEPKNGAVYRVHVQISRALSNGALAFTVVPKIDGKDLVVGPKAQHIEVDAGGNKQLTFDFTMSADAPANVYVLQAAWFGELTFSFARRAFR